MGIVPLNPREPYGVGGTGAFRGSPSAFANLTVRKIPNHFAKQFDWGRDDYRLAQT